MSSVADIAVRIGADISGLTSGLNDAGIKLDGFKSKMSQGAANVAKVGAAATVAGLAISAHLVKGALEAIDAQAKMAQQIGTSSASLATLKRAGDLGGVSMAQITAASKKLSIQMGEAADSSSTQAETFNRLGLSVESLSKMSLDERIAAVNSAIKENIPITEQAAVAAELFGSKAGFAVATLDNGAMENARKQTELFGLALSDIDAAKVEQANDAMSTFGAATDGAVQQATVQLAPILKSLGDLFLENAEKSGGMAKMVSNSFSTIIDVIGFVADAFSGVQRVGEIAFGAIGTLISSLVFTAAEAVKGLLMIADLLPSIDMSSQIASVQEFQDSIQQTADEHVANMADALNRPMPSEGLKQFVKDAQAAGEAAAAATVQAREAAAANSGANAQPQDIEEDKEIKKAREKAAKLAEIEAERAAKALENQQLATAASLDQLNTSYMSETERLMQKLEDEQILIDQALLNKQISQEEARALELRSVEGFEAAKTEVERRESETRARQIKDEQRQRFAAINQGLGALSALSDGESKKAFKRKKQVGIATALVNMYQGISEGVALGFPMAIPAVAYAAATGLSAINSIRSQSASSSGGGGSVVSSMQPVTQQMHEKEPPQGSSSNMFVQGINKNDLFSGQQLVDMINMATQSGAVLRLS